MKLKLTKFDIIHPSEYLDQKKGEWTDLATLSQAAYRDRLIRLRSNYSDFYTYHLHIVGMLIQKVYLHLKFIFPQPVVVAVQQRHVLTSAGIQVGNVVDPSRHVIVATGMQNQLDNIRVLLLILP